MAETQKQGHWIEHDDNNRNITKDASPRIIKNEKLISANALIAFHCKDCSAYKEGLCDPDEGLVCGVVQAILNAPAVNAVEAVCEPMRVEIHTNGFLYQEAASAAGMYRKHYFCPSCNLEIGHKTFDEKRKILQGTIMKDNQFPKFCPNCGKGICDPDNIHVERKEYNGK